MIHVGLINGHLLIGTVEARLGCIEIQRVIDIDALDKPIQMLCIKVSTSQLVVG